MKRFIQWMLLVGLWTSTSCSIPQNTAAVTPATVQPSHYIALRPNQSIQDFVGQRIWIEGELSNIIHQHMMKGGLNGTPPYVYVDYHNDRQLVAYFEKGLEPPTKMGKSYRFYGVVNSISGAGKGGGTYTEYYLDVLRVE